MNIFVKISVGEVFSFIEIIHPPCVTPYTSSYSINHMISAQVGLQLVTIRYYQMYRGLSGLGCCLDPGECWSIQSRASQICSTSEYAGHARTGTFSASRDCVQIPATCEDDEHPDELRWFPKFCAEILWMYKPTVASAGRGTGLRQSRGEEA